MSEEGYMYSVKMKIVDHISGADESLSPATTHVLPSLDEQMWKYDTNNMPIVTVRIGPSSPRELIQGRQLGGRIVKKIGNFISYFFTAHIFTTINETENEDKDKNGMNIADKIEEYLSRSDDALTGIKYYYEITKRESPSGMAKVSKVIVEGYVFCRKPFNIS
jgi:hypothetical protein